MKFRLTDEEKLAIKAQEGLQDIKPTPSVECKCLCHTKLVHGEFGRVTYCSKCIKEHHTPQTDKTTDKKVWCGTHGYCIPVILVEGLIQKAKEEEKKTWKKTNWDLQEILYKKEALDAYRGKVKKLKKDNNWAVRDYKNGYNKAIDDALLEIEREKV